MPLGRLSGVLGRLLAPLGRLRGASWTLLGRPCAPQDGLWARMRASVLNLGCSFVCFFAGNNAFYILCSKVALLPPNAKITTLTVTTRTFDPWLFFCFCFFAGGSIFYFVCSKVATSAPTLNTGTPALPRLRPAERHNFDFAWPVVQRRRYPPAVGFNKSSPTSPFDPTQVPGYWNPGLPLYEKT